MKNIYRYKKIIIATSMLLIIFLTLIEFIKYFSVESNLFGLNYMIINFIIIFLIVPVVYNYNRYYSPQRISKLIIIIVLGLFNSYILQLIVLNTMTYTDYSQEYINSIFWTKNVLKGIIYFVLIAFTIFEFKLEEMLIKSKKISKKKRKK